MEGWRMSKLYPVSKYSIISRSGEKDTADLYDLTKEEHRIIKRNVVCNKIIAYYGKLYFKVEE